MNYLYKVLSLCFVVLFLSACASKQHESSLVDKNLQLKQSPYDENVYYYLDKNVDYSAYSKVIVPKIKIENEGEGLNQKLKLDISNYFTEGLEKALNEAVASNKGAKELKFEVNIDNISTAYEDLQFYNFIPVSLAIKGILRGTGLEDKDLHVLIALKISDVKTNKVLSVAVSSKKVENLNELKELDFEKVKPLLDEWIERFKLRLKEFSQGKYGEL